MTSTEALTVERRDLLSTLDKHRSFLKFTARSLTEEQVRLAPSASVLSVGGLIKHVLDGERRWTRFIEGGAELMRGNDVDGWASSFTLDDGETMADVLAEYEAAAEHTAELIRTVDLDAAHPLPEAPWFEPGATWTNRRVLLHILAETAQHAGHADVVRETIDGQKTMG
jgi:uncharacterized damage-inducible protein DinB